MSTSIDLQTAISAVILYLLYTLSLAGAVQVAINELKPLFLDALKAKLTDQQYTITFYLFRIAVTSAGYFYVWGGVAATRAVVTLAFIPDYGVAIGTIAIVVLGEEVIHPLLDRVYALRDAAKLLAELPPVTPPVPTPPA